MNFENYKDEELINICRTENSAEASNEIINRYRYMAKSIAHSYFISGGDEEDLEQEGLIGLMNAVTAYKNDGSSFCTFAHLCIMRSVQTAIKKDNRKKNIPLNNYISIYASNDSEDGNNDLVIKAETCTPEESYINQEGVTELYANFSKNLSKKEYQILLLFLEGYSYREIGEKLSIKSKSVDNAMQRIRKKVENIIKR